MDQSGIRISRRRRWPFLQEKIAVKGRQGMFIIRLQGFTRARVGTLGTLPYLMNTGAPLDLPAELPSFLNLVLSFT